MVSSSVRSLARLGLMKEVSSKIRNWCALAERSPAQVLRKLAGWDFGPEAEAELEALVKDGYVSAERFAEAFIHDHVLLKNWGPAKVWAALRQVHAIDSAVISAGMHALGEDEITAAAERALNGWQKIRRDAPADKAIAALLRKGFSLDCARRALDALDAD